jgi:uncharacterized membrane protein
MKRLGTHLQNKFLAGALAAAPIAVVAYIVYLLEVYTQPLADWLGLPFPGLGLLLTLAGVYLLGVVVTSVFGRFALRLGDRALRHIPGLRLVYQAWKEILVTPIDRPNTFHEVVLVPIPEGGGAQLGFTSGVPVPGDPASVCLPNVPNPITGRLIVVRRDRCLSLKMSAEDAFKFLLSTGNHQPEGLRGHEPAGRPD